MCAEAGRHTPGSGQHALLVWMPHQEVEKNVRNTCCLGVVPEDSTPVRATSMPRWTFLTQLQPDWRRSYRDRLRPERVVPRCAIFEFSGTALHRLPRLVERLETKLLPRCHVERLSWEPAVDVVSATKQLGARTACDKLWKCQRGWGRYTSQWRGITPITLMIR